MTKELNDKLADFAAKVGGSYTNKSQNKVVFSAPGLDKLQLAKLLNLLNRAKANYSIAETKTISSGIDVTITAE